MTKPVCFSDQLQQLEQLQQLLMLHQWRQKQAMEAGSTKPQLLCSSATTSGSAPENT